MRARLEAGLEWAFPGMGWRPLWLTLLASYLLVVYWHQGSPSSAPDWFIQAATEQTGIEEPRFHRHGWAHLSALVVLLAVPLGVCWKVEGWGPRELGLGIRGTGREFALVVTLWALFVPVVWWFSSAPDFAKTYPRLQAAETDAWLFFLYQSFYLVKWTAWEFFFRGFMLFGFFKDFGTRAVLVSTIPFVIMHGGKPELEMAGSVLAGLILCFIALRSRSIWPGVFLHSMVATTMDFFASSWWRATPLP